MGQTTMQVTLDDNLLLYFETLGMEGGKSTVDALYAMRSVLARAKKTASVSEGFCLKCRRSKDIAGLARFPNGMDTTFAHEITDAIGMLRSYKDLCEMRQEVAVGQEVDRWHDKIAAAGCTIKTLGDRVKLYTGIIAQLRDEEARERGDDSEIERIDDADSDDPCEDAP
jgi:hypothetical protein